MKGCKTLDKTRAKTLGCLLESDLLIVDGFRMGTNLLIDISKNILFFKIALP